MQSLLSPRLQQLQATLAHSTPMVLVQFWDEMTRTGTPLIEPLDAQDCLVTFLWRDDGQTSEIAVVQDWGADGIPEHIMARLPDSDIWYKTRRMRVDTRTTYQLWPNFSHPMTEGVPYRLDPLNPHTYPVFLAEAGNDILFSYLALPAAPGQPWKTAHVARGQVTLHHPLKDGTRVWVYTSPGSLDLPCSLLLAFDGRLYKDMLDLPALLDYLVAEQRMPPVVALLVDNPNRAQELTCNPAYADSIAQQLVPWAQATYPIAKEARRTVITGSSFGGLAAAYLGLRYPQLFGNVLAQTGWFRWRPEGDAEFEWLARQFVEQPKLPLRFYLDVGNLETARMNDDGPTQVVANRHMRDVLRAKGYEVHYVEYSGGHDYSSLQNSLLEALALLLNAD